jgi:hypothetical protein
LKSDDKRSNISGKFDLIHSFLVFQHIPRRRGEKIFVRLIELLSPNGIAVIQFLYHLNEPSVLKAMGFLRKKIPLFHNFTNLVYEKPFFFPLMEKNTYDIKRVLAILHETRCGNLYLRFYGNGRLHSVILFFQKKQDNVPYNSYEKD